MIEKVQTFWKSLDRRIVVNQRELVLGLAVCTLAGIVTGIALSPRKNVAIGNNNGSNNSGNTGTVVSSDEEEAEDEE